MAGCPTSNSHFQVLLAIWQGNWRSPLSHRATEDSKAASRRTARFPALPSSSLWATPAGPWLTRCPVDGPHACTEPKRSARTL